LDLQLPTIQIDTAQGQLEETYLRSTIVIGHQRDGCPTDNELGQRELSTLQLTLDKQLLGLIKNACQADKLEQALELAKLLSQPQSLIAASKLAEYFHAAGLRERIEILTLNLDETLEGRRESKWSHLVDDRIIVDSRRLVDSKMSSVDPLAQPFSDIRPQWPRKSMRQNLPAVAIPEDSGVGSSDAFDDEEVEVDDALAQEVITPKESIRPAPMANNPFKKVPGANAFGKKANNDNSLKKSHSFFDRVESVVEKTKGKTNAAHRQSTLFDALPPKSDETETRKRNKKRKSTEDEGDEDGKVERSTKDIKTLFATASERKQMVVEEVEETQLVGLTIEKKARLDEVDENDDLALVMSNGVTIIPDQVTLDA